MGVRKNWEIWIDRKNRMKNIVLWNYRSEKDEAKKKKACSCVKNEGF